MAVLPKVVVVGAGFGGLEVARALADRPVDITLVDRNNFHTFQPLLYQVATAGLNAADVAHVVRGPLPPPAQRRASGRPPSPASTGTPARSLLDGHRPPPVRPPRAWPAAPPSPTSARPARPSTASPLYTLADAVQLRNHILERFEAADADRRRPSTTASLTFVVVGGGPTGVEMAGALAELFAMVFRKDYPELDVSRARVVLVEMQDHLLGPFAAAEPPARARHARPAAASRCALGTAVAEVTPTAVASRATARCCRATRSCGRPACRPTRWPPRSALEQGRGGRIVVGPDLRVPGRDGVWAIGDIAAAHRPPTASCCPQLAPVAMQAGRHVARQIARLAEGKPTEPFRYRDKGTMATIGRRAAVAELPRRHPPPRRPRVAGLARPAPRVPRRQAQPGVGAPQLGLELPHLGPRPAPAVPPRRADQVPRSLRRMTADADDHPSHRRPLHGVLLRRDKDALLACFADDAWIEDPVGTPRREGKDGHRRVLGPDAGHGRLDRAASAPGPCASPPARPPSRCRPARRSAAPRSASTSST